MKLPFVPVIAAAAIGLSVYHVSHTQAPAEQAAPPVEPARSPFGTNVAGAGVVESRSENVEIAANVSGVVKKLLVSEGEIINAGQLVLTLDARDVEAEIDVREAFLENSQAETERLRAMPRPEEIPPLSAAVAEAEALLRQAEDRYERQQSLVSKGVSTQEELVVARSDREAAEAQLEKVKADLALLKAGSWQQDVMVSEANVKKMKAELNRYQTELARHEVTAPASEWIDTTVASEKNSAGANDKPAWEVLQINARPGEYISTPPQEPVMILGDLGPRRIRVDIDEHDLTRFRPSGKAVAYPRGDGEVSYPLKFVRVDPYVIPKRSLTGDNADRVDTRVLQVIYEFESRQENIYVGQQMDVFIDTSARND